MGNKNKTIIILLILLVLALLVYWAQGRNQSGIKLEQEVSDQNLELGQPRNAKAGELVTGFPRDLIVNKQAVIISSSVTPYVENHKQYSTTYTTGQSIEKEFNDYLTYLKGNKYTIAKQQIDSSLGAIYATSENADVNVNIYLDVVSNKNTVVVSYLMKK
jgi:hypothetical protein